MVVLSDLCSPVTSPKWMKFIYKFIQDLKAKVNLVCATFKVSFYISIVRSCFLSKFALKRKISYIVRLWSHVKENKDLLSPIRVSRMLEKIIKDKSSAQIGFIIALLATFCYSLKPIIIKLIYEYDEVTSEDILAWRVIISLPVYVLVGIWVLKKKFGKSESTPGKDESTQGDDAQEEGAIVSKPWFWKSVILGAIGFYLAALLDLIGLHYISSQLARLILFTYPTLVAILGWVIYRQKISRSVAIALVLSYIGVGLIFAYDFQNLGEDVVFGSVMMFLSVLAFSLYVLLSKSVIDQVGGAAFTVVAMLSSGVCILIHFMISAQMFNWLSLDSVAFWLIVLMTLVTTVIPSFLIAEAISLVGPQKTSIAGTVGPAITSVFAVLLLDEVFGPSQLMGIILVVAAITYMQRDTSKG